MRIVLLLAITLSLFTIALAQDQGDPNRNPSMAQTEVSLRPPSPPKLQLRRAVTLAQRQLNKRNVSIRHYYLVEAKYTTFSVEGHSMPCWRLLWARNANRHSDEPDIEAYVFMDGKVQLLNL